MIAFLLLALVSLPAAGQKKKKGGGPSPPGTFDYYVLSLSWSPEHCASPAGKNDNLQCGGDRRFGFVVHGLWPQFERGFPQSCAAGPALTEQQVSSALDLMPSPKLVRHEWLKHGTCSGLTPAQYLDTVRAARGKFGVPADLQQPSDFITIETAKLKQKLLAANPGLPAAGMAIVCRGRFLQEVRVCYTKDLKPRPCGAGVRDRCNAEKAVLRPVR